MKPPIIVDEKGDILIFSSVEAASAYIEPIDARNGEYVVYDSEGYLLEASVVKERQPWLFGISSVDVEVVKIDKKTPESKNDHQLMKLLKNYLSNYVIPRSLAEKATLGDLIDTVAILFKSSK